VINCHFHDERSSDGAGRLEAHCREAAAAGFRHVCVTNHAEILGPDGCWMAELSEMRDRFLAQCEAVAACRPLFPELNVLSGIELEFRPEWTDAFDRLTEEIPFDFVLGSVHQVDGFNVSGGPGREAYFAGRSQEEAYSRYFDELLEMLEWGRFDVVSHFDLVKRFGHAHYGGYEPEDYREAIEAALGRMADRGIGIEVNTSGVRRPGVPFPERRILEWAREAAVPTLTIGTDSHEPDRFGRGLAEGIDLAAAAGWEELTVYEKRRPAVQVPIGDARAWAAGSREESER